MRSGRSSFTGRPNQRILKGGRVEVRPIVSLATRQNHAVRGAEQRAVVRYERRAPAVKRAAGPEEWAHEPRRVAVDDGQRLRVDPPHDVRIDRILKEEAAAAGE